jgi:hypothetical protein
MIYVGHSKFRWRPMSRVLRAVEQVRSDVGRIGLVGHGWDKLPWWATTMNVEDSYQSDPSYLKKLGIEVMAPVPFKQVIETMSRAVFNPVLLRPTFNFMRIVNPRMFETPAANTIPLLVIDREHVREIYGDDAAALVLEDNGPETILDIVRRPAKFYGLLIQIRKYLAMKHSHTTRLKQLIEIIKS